MFIIGDGAILIWGADPTALPKPGFLNASLHFGNIVFPSYRLFVICIGILVGLGLWFLQERTKWGAILRASVDDEQMARGVGINVPLVFTLVFLVGISLTGVSGVLGGPFVGAYPGVDIEVLLLAVVVIIVGGLGSMKGLSLEASLSPFGQLWQGSLPELAMFTIFAPMAIVLALKPTGLWGRFEPEILDHNFYLYLGFSLCIGPLVLPEYYIGLVTRALILAILAMSINLLLGHLGLASVGHGVFFGIASYTVAILTLRIGITPWCAMGIAILSAVIAAGLFGFLATRTKDIFFLAIMLAFCQVFYASQLAGKPLPEVMTAYLAYLDRGSFLA